MVVYDLRPDACVPFKISGSVTTKDVGLAMALGRGNVSLSLANITEQILIEGINRGWGDKSAYGDIQT